MVRAAILMGPELHARACNTAAGRDRSVVYLPDSILAGMPTIRHLRISISNPGKCF
jgi:hypothetical protein